MERKRSPGLEMSGGVLCYEKLIKNGQRFKKEALTLDYMTESVRHQELAIVG